MPQGQTARYVSSVEVEPLTCVYVDASRTLFVSGSVDETATERLREAMEKYSVGYTQDLIVDLGDVNFLPSVGVGVLAAATRQADATGHTLGLIALDGSVPMQVLRICGLPHSTR